MLPILRSPLPALLGAAALGLGCRSAAEPVVEPTSPAVAEAPAVPDPVPEWLGPPGAWALLHFQSSDGEFPHLDSISQMLATFCHKGADMEIHHLDVAIGQDLSAAIWIEDELGADQARCTAEVIAGFLRWPKTDVHLGASERGTLVLLGGEALQPVTEELARRITHDPGMVSFASNAGEGETAWSFDVETIATQTRVSIGLSSEDRAIHLEEWMRRGLEQKAAESLHALGVVRKGRGVHLGLADAGPVLGDYERSALFATVGARDDAMLPNAADGETFIVDRVPPERGYQRGDVVSFGFPGTQNQYYSARIVALGGDKIRWIGNQLEIDGTTVRVEATSIDGAAIGLPDETKLAAGTIFRESIGDTEHLVMMPPPLEAEPDPTLRDPAWQEVPDGFVITRLDNRGVWVMHFAVPVEDILGIARVVAISVGPEGLRHARMGRPF